MATNKKVKNIPVRLDEETHKALKHYVVEQETTIQSYIVQLIREDLKRQGFLVSPP